MKRRMSDIAVMMLSFLVLLALSAGAALVRVEAVRGEQWQLIRLTAWLQGSGVWGGIACIAVAVLALVLALMCLWRVFPHRTASQRGYVMQKNENGSIGVSIRAIEGLIRTCIDKHEAIAKADITVEECRDGIAIGLHIIQAAGVNIPLSVGAHGRGCVQNPRDGGERRKHSGCVHLRGAGRDASAVGGGNGGTADGHAPGTARRDSRDRAGAEAESAGHVHFPGG